LASWLSSVMDAIVAFAPSSAIIPTYSDRRIQANRFERILL
jgi:hypothetical protein